MSVPSFSSSHLANSAACLLIATTGAALALSKLDVVMPPALIRLSTSLGLPTPCPFSWC